MIIKFESVRFWSLCCMSFALISCYLASFNFISFNSKSEKHDYSPCRARLGYSFAFLAKITQD